MKDFEDPSLNPNDKKPLIDFNDPAVIQQLQEMQAKQNKGKHKKTI